MIRPGMKWYGTFCPGISEMVWNSLSWDEMVWNILSWDEMVWNILSWDENYTG